MIFRNETKRFPGKPGSSSCRAVFIWVAILLLSGHISGQQKSQTIPIDDSPGITENTWDNGLQVRLLIGKKAAAKAQNILTYALRYEQFPVLAAAFLYLVRQEPELYKNVQYHSKSLAVYGNPFISLPDRLHSLPNFRSVAHPQAGLAFWRNGSVLRSDILALHTAETAHKDQNNLVFFADLLGEPDKQKLKHGLQFLDVEATSNKAQSYLDSLTQDQDAYQKRLEQDWQSYMQINWPEISVLLENGEGWQRNEFGYYYRPIIQGQRALPKIGEDLNITLEQRDFAGLRAQSLPVIVAFGKDTLPMPFPYFVSRTPKGSEVEILSPPSAVRSHLSRLGTETGGTRYQWLQDSFAGESWVYLRFALELP